MDNGPTFPTVDSRLKDEPHEHAPSAKKTPYTYGSVDREWRVKITVSYRSFCKDTSYLDQSIVPLFFQSAKLHTVPILHISHSDGSDDDDDVAS